MYVRLTCPVSFMPLQVNAMLMILQIVMHTGGLPGATAQISFMPLQGIAVVTLISADDKSSSASGPLLYKIIDDLFTTNSSTAVGRELSAAPWRTTSSDLLDLKTPPSALESYAGTYNNSGYHSFTICAPSTASQYCAEVLSAFATVDTHASVSGLAAHPIDTPQLFAAFPSVWGSYIRFAHIDGQRFTFGLTSLYVEGYGADKTPFEALAEGAEIEFVVDEESGKVKGFGLRGTVKEKRTDRERKGGGIQETADAWFDRV